MHNLHGAFFMPKRRQQNDNQHLRCHWAIIESNEADDDRLHDCDGCCDWTTREIVV